MAAEVSPRLRLLVVTWDSHLNRILNLLLDRQAPDVDVAVAVLDHGEGPLADDLAARAVPLHPLHAVGPRRSGLAATRLRRLLREVDAVQSHMFWPGFVMELARTGMRRPPASVLTRHHNVVHHAEGKRIHVAMDGWSGRRATRVVAVSGAVARTMTERERVPAERIEVIHNGFDWSAIAPDPAGVARWRERFGSPLVVASGRLDPVKDLPTLLRALVVARREHPSAQLAIAGPGPAATVESLRALARELGIGDAVHLLGWVDRPWDLYGAADAFAQASVDEACSQTITEAAGLGVPIAVTTTGGTPEIVGALQPSVPAGDPEALGARLALILRDPDAVRAESAAEVAALRARFDADVMAAAHDRAVRTAVARQRGEAVAPA